jgi:hypothetical protein
MNTPTETLNHPAPQQIERFVKGQCTRGETRDVVRHLLLGCPTCRQAVRPLWGLR